MIATRRQRSIAPVLIWLGFVAGSAPGELIIFRFEGVITDVQLMGPLLMQNWPQVGAPFQGTYSFESTAGDSTTDPSFESLPPAGVRVQVGVFDLHGTGTIVSTYDDVATTPPYDLYEAGDWLSSLEFLSHPELGDVLNRNNFQLHLRGNTDLLDGVALPLTPPDLANATEARLSLSLDDRFNTTPIPYVYIAASLESLTLVPEPRSLVMFGMAVCASRLSWRNRRIREQNNAGVSYGQRRPRRVPERVHQSYASGAFQLTSLLALVAKKQTHPAT
jgi:hypothetical protein